LRQVALRAFAKVNLGLAVLGRRPDGFHEIRTVLMTVSLHDRLEIRLEGRGIALEVDDPTLPSGPENLVFRAADRLLGGLRDPPGVALRLYKKIPAGSGLGGGSSDAAAVLVGIDRLLDLRLDPAILARHAAALGSDVPYFLTGGAALATGRGADITPLPDPPARELLIVHPGTALSTREVYAQFEEPLTLAPKPASIPGFERIPVDIASWVRSGNDLEPHAVRLCPAIGAIRSLLQSAGAEVAAMTGSGSAVFGVFADAGARDRAADEAERSGFGTFRCHTLDRAAYLRDRMFP
jgi:4-diphosphocytidyl-2-C-methyl-D-erythritol kinase